MKKTSATYKLGQIVTPRWFIPGYPLGLCVESRLVVREVRKRDKRLRVESDDGRQGSWWVDFDAMRVWGMP